MAYKLDGVDKDWVYLSYDKNSAFYNQLKKGTYSFWLKWKYGQGKWTEGKVVLAIVQAPAFYETLVGIYGLLCFDCTCCLSVFFILMRSVLKSKNEVKTKKKSWHGQN